MQGRVVRTQEIPVPTRDGGPYIVEIREGYNGQLYIRKVRQFSTSTPELSLTREGAVALAKLINNIFPLDALGQV